MIGDTYLGKAPIVGYNGQSGGTGSFVTDNWVADSATYPSSGDSYQYRVNQGNTIKELVQIIDNNAIKYFQNLLTRAKAIIDNTMYAGAGIVAVENDYYSLARYYTLDASNTPTVIDNLTRAQILPGLRRLDHSVRIAEEEIESLPK
jgi:hypothetical protein